MSATITVQTARGPVTAPTVWRGVHLAVHRPLSKENPSGFSTAPGQWTVTHQSTGYAACVRFHGAKNRAVALAKQWDAAFAAITETGTANGWPWVARWADDITRAERGRPIIGPRELTPLEQLDSAGSAADVERAVWRAMGYTPAPEPEASEQYPADVTLKQTGSGAVRRNPDSGALEFWWLPQGGNYPFHEATSLAGWYEIPALADVERWCLGSVAETPCGDRVEPDHPDAWPRLLGVI